MFKLNYIRKSKLPKLSWLADFDKKNNCIDVFCGDKVESFSNFFVAGVWDGDFIEGKFDNSNFFLGSGARIVDNDKIVFSSASHALEKIWLNNDNEKIVISNSFPFIVSYMDYDLDLKNDQYEADLCSILDGIEKYKNEIKLAKGNKIYQYFVSNIEINSNFEIKVCRKKSMKDFIDFNDYYGRLMQDLELIRNNAKSLQRKNSSFGLVSTISSGYDSCACATVAKKLGCETVVSLKGGKYDEDLGDEVALQLGYKSVIKKEKDSYHSKLGNIDAEYVCNGELGTHLQFSVFDDIFADNLVFMGLRGDYYWGKNTEANNDFYMKDFFYYETNIGYIENALKNGYIIVPLPTYGTSSSTSIRRITNSKEMDNWSLNTNYDRPIPRRIVESSGVSRESFGQKKSGGGFSFGYGTLKSLKLKMTNEGYNSFCSYLNVKSHTRNSLSKFSHQIQFNIKLLPTYINFILRKMKFNKCLLKQKALRISNPGIPCDLIFWSVSIMKQRYKDAIK